MIKTLIKFIIPNLIIILSGIILMFIFLDNLNPTMDFLNNKLNITLLIIFCFISIFNTILLLVKNLKE